MKKFIPLVLGFMLLAAFLVGGCSRQAEGKYPSKPIEFVVHSTPGTGVDVFARVIADTWQKEKIVSVPVTVNNKTGGGGAVARNYVAKENKGNPYVIITSQPTALTGPLRSNSDVPPEEFTPLMCLASEEILVAVKEGSPYKTLKDLLDAAHQKPEFIKFGGGAAGSADTMVAYLISKAAGVKFNNISFTGGGETPAALLGGTVDFICASPSEVIGQVEAKKIKLLGVASEKRIDLFPDVPTLREQGIDVVFHAFRGVVAPKDIPAEAQKYLTNALQKVTKTQAWKKYMKDNALTELIMDAPTFEKYLKEENARYKTIIEAMGLTKKK